MTNPTDWEMFCDKAAAMLRQALDREIELKQASDFFEQDKLVKNQDLRRYFESMVWEIDSSRDYYVELVRLFEARASEETFVNYLDAK